MSFQTVFNPFTRIAGFPALFYGCLVMLLTAAIAAPSGVNFIGSLNIHVSGPLPFGLILSWLVLGWLNAASFFFVAGTLFSKSKFRAVDVYGTLALARAPFLIAAPFGLLSGLWNIDSQQAGPMPVETVISLVIASIVFLLVDILVVIWSYNAFAVSVNVKNKVLFAAVLIISEIVAIHLSGLLTLWMPPPMDEKPENPAMFIVDPTKAPTLEDAEHIEIAKQFVKRIFAGTNDDSLEQFEVTDVMKKYVSAATFKQWAKRIVTDYGKPGDYTKIEVVRHDQQSRSVFLFFRCERYPVVMQVTFDDKAVSGFHFKTWMWMDENPENPAMVVVGPAKVPTPEDTEHVEIAE